MGGVQIKIDRNWQLLKLSIGQIEAHYILFFFSILGYVSNLP